MKNLTRKNLVVTSIIALVLALSLAIWSQVQAQAAGPADGSMIKHCQEMKEHKEKMAADMKAMDDELTAQVAAMNSAPKNQKMDLMAAVITRMVEQRIAMEAAQAKMDDEMMKHMMQHIQMGPASVAQCPMMQGMSDMKDKPAGVNKK